MKFKITYYDGSSVEMLIEEKYAPMVNDLLHRLEHLQRYKTAIYRTEHDIYNVEKNEKI
jgi:hypothetical protein